MIIIWIIVSIILFSVIVLVHEWWHFASARKFWVKVEEFWLWIPPRARKLFKDKKGTLFTLNWLPIWWFVKLYWESPEQLKNIDDKQALFNKPAWQQAIIILAWVFMNFLFAAIIFSVLFFIWVKPIWVNTKIETNLDLKLIPTYEQAIESELLIKDKWIILNPLKWSIADKYWIKAWDILIWINNKDLESTKEMMNSVSKMPWEKVIFNLQNRDIEITIWEDWKIWSYISENIKINKDFEYKYWPLDSIKYWFLETYNQVWLTFKWVGILLKKIFNPETPKERQEAIEQVSWPIWIVDFISNSLEAWIIFLFIIAAVISINLWVFNLLPIPALDGWRFIFITINGIIKKIFWKKAINEQTENLIHFLFFVFLIALSLIIAYNDINKIISS